jgi:hypothetical protein
MSSAAMPGLVNAVLGDDVIGELRKIFHFEKIFLALCIFNVLTILPTLHRSLPCVRCAASGDSPAKNVWTEGHNEKS